MRDDNTPKAVANKNYWSASILFTLSWYYLSSPKVSNSPPDTFQHFSTPPRSCPYNLRSCVYVPKALSYSHKSSFCTSGNLARGNAVATSFALNTDPTLPPTNRMHACSSRSPKQCFSKLLVAAPIGARYVPTQPLHP
jgi:hypothetical protein